MPSGSHPDRRHAAHRVGARPPILADWKTYLPMFRKVMPVEYRRALAELEKAQEAAMA